MEKLPQTNQKLLKKVEYLHEYELGSTDVSEDLTYSNNNEALCHKDKNKEFTNTSYDMLTSDENATTAMRRSAGVDARFEDIPRQVSSSNHDFSNRFTNDKKNYSGRTRRNKPGSSGSNDVNKQSLLTEPTTSDEEFAASQTTEAILEEIFGENTRIPKHRNFKTRYSNGEVFDDTSENYDGIETTSHGGNFLIKTESGYMRNKVAYNDTSRKHVNTDERNNEGSCSYGGNSGTRNGKEVLPCSGTSHFEIENNARNHPMINGVRRLFHDTVDTSSKQGYFFENAPFLNKYPTSSNIPFTKPDALGNLGRTQATESLLHLKDGVGNTSTLMRSVNITPTKTTPSFSASNRTPVVQSNVIDYYENLRNEGNIKSRRETSVTERVTPRNGLRSTSSEMPVKDALPSLYSSSSLSKSWGSTQGRKEFLSLDKKTAKDQTDGRKMKIEQMFQMEEKISLKRAKDFDKLKLLRKVFGAWQRRAQVMQVKADQLCRKHLLRKAMKGLAYATEHQRMAVDDFVVKQRKVLVQKCWQMWRRKTSERQRKTMQEIFSQWRYYKLHVERTKLLQSIANRHFLSKKYSKWKAKFNSKQKNSLASVHFKINLIYKFWNFWAVYVRERRVKNRLNSIARYHYGEKTQCHLFHYWKSITQKSLLSRRLTRRRVLLKAFFHWKHWTQYAKIVHLRLQNMCKEYHKKTLTRRMFKKWRQAKRMKLALDFCRKTQQSRAMKLWNLRYMRKRIHKHLCKALARKAKKRRFLTMWICFVKQQKTSRADFIKILEIVQTRTFFNSWKNKTIKRIEMRKSMQRFQEEKAKRLFREQWEYWKFQLRILEMRNRSQNNWSLRCVRKCCEVWKLKVKKVKLGIKFHQSGSTFEMFVVKRYFKSWQLELQKVREENTRAQHLGRILQKNKLGRILQAWRVVNQEECIIEPLVKRRVRRDMAKVFDAWRRYILRGKYLRTLHNTKNYRVKRDAWERWRVKQWCIAKEKEVVKRLHFLKLERHFFVWLEYVKDLQESEKMAEERKQNMMRRYIETWKNNAQQKAELREAEHTQRARRQILLRCFFTSWKHNTTEHAQIMTSMIRKADETKKRMLQKRSFSRWRRQYAVEHKTQKFIKLKWNETLKTVILAWKDFAKIELERQVCDFATNLAMDSSQGSAFLSTSGYQTSLKNSSSSFQFLPADEMFSPIPTPRSRPMTPTLSHDDVSAPRSYVILPSYRPVTMEAQNTGLPISLVSERPTSRCTSPLIRQHSLEQISQTSQQRSSEEDALLSSGLHSSGVHSAGDESDQDDRASVHITESLYSYQTTSDSVVRDRELLVAETIIHWRSLSLSVAFRSWCKYTRHVNLVRSTYAEWMARDKEKLLTKYLAKWRRWLFVSVLARQHWVNQMKKKFLLQWTNYYKQQVRSCHDKNGAHDFSTRNLLKKFYNIWKQKRTTKCQLQNIVLRWQMSAKVTDMDKQVIDQYKKIDRQNCLRRTFHYWKKATHCSQQATNMSQTLLLRRCFPAWRDIASFRAEHRRKMKTHRNKHILAKAFNEWLVRYEDVRTARIILGVSEERKIDKIFKAWHSWASATSYRRKTSLAYYRFQEQKRLKEKFSLWFAAAKQCINMRECYHETLMRRVLTSWRAVLIRQANDNLSIQGFQSIVLKNLLRSTFVFWRQRTKNKQIIVEYAKLKEKQHLASAFNQWKQQKRKKDAKKHCLQNLMKKTFACWCEQILKRNKARQHFKFWQTKAEANKELNEVADTLVNDSKNRLLRMKFMLWKKLTKHSQVARYHHETKMLRRHFLGWYDYYSKEKIHLNKLKEFQQSHLRNDSGLLTKYMKIWLNKSTFSTKAENLHKETLYVRYWKIWRHNFVRRRVSSAMVHHDNQKILSKVFISWFNVTASHTSLAKEIKRLYLRKWFRKWMARYNNS